MRASEEADFTAWAREVQHRLLRVAYLVSGDATRAEDLVQEALTKVALRWSRLADGDPTAYARRIVVRDNVSWWRRHRREHVTGAVPDAAVSSAEPETALVVRQALQRLAPRQRAVVVLRHLEGLDVAATAAVLNISPGTVKSQNASALARLRTAAPELLDLVGRSTS